VASGDPSTMILDPIVAEASSGKNIAWSQGLGLKLSPIKTRSARKKSGTNPSIPTTSSHSSIEQGALRGIESLTRAKS